ncbi:hypothetical protein RFM26_08085 [Mesorhizobium sp. VK23B]|uniref:Uncharacterized protein n=1 Tax=Mesorhizobium dulcispinae TaxID=3072316 RepID=A0ABU4XAM8_9HYPH|nr:MULTISPECIES: hypothetical protein [unclassified Mesorhizobium]MDX8465640.1 hypothetical protein [Mesorhizobium sp. VK23B]MDX8471558.1 hypothetical protein [Mesorhizobium sp. VK23A]
MIESPTRYSCVFVGRVITAQQGDAYKPATDLRFAHKALGISRGDFVHICASPTSISRPPVISDCAVFGPTEGLAANRCRLRRRRMSTVAARCRMAVTLARILIPQNGRGRKTDQLHRRKESPHQFILTAISSNRRACYG